MEAAAPAERRTRSLRLSADAVYLRRSSACRSPRRRCCSRPRVHDLTQTWCGTTFPNWLDWSEPSLVVRDPRAGARRATGRRPRSAAARPWRAQPAREDGHGLMSGRVGSSILLAALASLGLVLRPGGAADRDRTRAASARRPSFGLPEAGGPVARARGRVRGDRGTVSAGPLSPRSMLLELLPGAAPFPPERWEVRCLSRLRRRRHGSADLHWRRGLGRAPPGEPRAARPRRLRHGEDLGSRLVPSSRRRGLVSRCWPSNGWRTRIAGRYPAPPTVASLVVAGLLIGRVLAFVLPGGRGPARWTSCCSRARPHCRSSSPRAPPGSCCRGGT